MVIGEKHNPYLTLYDTHRLNVESALNSYNRETGALPYIRGLGLAPRCLFGLAPRRFGVLGLSLTEMTWRDGFAFWASYLACWGP